MRALRSLYFYLTFLVVLISDQVSKYLILEKLNFAEQIEIVPGFFNLTLAYNKGVAFGIFAGVSDELRPYILAFVTVLALGVLLFLLVKQYSRDLIAGIAIAGILGGAIGNLIDRFYYGHVIDFLDVYYKSHHWPAFNIADSCICIGVFILLLRPDK